MQIFIKQNGGALNCSDDASVAATAAEKDITCVLLEEFSEPDEIVINTSLILQNMLDVTVTALVVQNKREHPNPVKFVETVVPNYCDPTFAADWADIFDTPTKQEKTYLKPHCTPFPGNMSFNPETVAKRWAPV